MAAYTQHPGFDTPYPQAGGQPLLIRSPPPQNGFQQTSGTSHQNWLLWILLLLSVAWNASYVSFQAWQYSPSKDALADQEVHSDTDGDGVPDHHDLCPSLCKGDLCPPMGWLSGRATDFDGDGCADGSEDHDKDNDGIQDSKDSCPYTPQEYVFVSNTGSDFDGDGCADGLEDKDDDNDLVPNLIDICPLTASGEEPDSQGCSELQRELRAKFALFKALPPDSLPSSESQEGLGESGDEEPTRLESWIEAIKGSGIEVIVGAILSAICGHAYNVYTHVEERLPEPIRRMSFAGTPQPPCSTGPVLQPPELVRQMSGASAAMSESAFSLHSAPSVSWDTTLKPIGAIARLRAH